MTAAPAVAAPFTPQRIEVPEGVDLSTADLSNIDFSNPNWMDSLEPPQPSHVFDTVIPENLVASAITIPGLDVGNEITGEDYYIAANEQNNLAAVIEEEFTIEDQATRRENSPVHFLFTPLPLSLMIANGWSAFTEFLGRNIPEAPTDPWATATIELISAGTGHGTASQTFVNSANGFFPGDNTPYDRVVSSNDTVLYDIGLQFAASRARVVVVALDLPPYLEWRTGGDLLCQHGNFVSARRVGNTCEFTVPAGAVERINLPLILHARDSRGEAQANQAVSITVGLRGDSTFARQAALPVTVVSAPAVDVILTVPGFTSLLLNPTRISQSSAFNSTSSASRSIVATPTPLSWPGHHPRNGVATGGSWWGYLDVSDFPEDTIWRISGVEQEVIGGRIEVLPRTGAITFNFEMPGGVWPEIEMGSSLDWRAQIHVDPMSFATSTGFLNNGDGSQPGDGLSCNQSTSDARRGAIAGRPLANNDCAIVRIVELGPPPPGSVFNFSIRGSRNTNYTVWSQQNIEAGNNVAQRMRRWDSWWYADTSGWIAPGTALDLRLQAYTPNVTDYIDDWQFLFGHTWNHDYYTFDTSRSMIVRDASNRQVASHLYTIQWHEEVRTLNQITDPNDEGWQNTPPTEEALSIRIIFEPHAVPVRDEPGAGWWGFDFPVTVGTHFTQVDHNRIIATPAHFAFVRDITSTSSVNLVDDEITKFLASSEYFTEHLPEDDVTSEFLEFFHAESLLNLTEEEVIAFLEDEISAFSDDDYLNGYEYLDEEYVNDEVYLGTNDDANEEYPHSNSDYFDYLSSTSWEIRNRLTGVGDFILSLPPVPRFSMNMWVTGSPTVSAPEVIVGERVSFTVGSSSYYPMRIFDVPDTSMAIAPTVVVTLDRCLSQPLNSSQWRMAVTPAVPGPTGRVCGDPLSTPAVLTFTFAPSQSISWTNRLSGQGNLPSLSFSAVPSVLSSGALVSSAVLSAPQAPLAVSDSASIVTLSRETTSAALESIYYGIERDGSLRFSAQLYSFAGSEGGADADVVMVLPRLNDGHLFGGDFDEDGFDGPRESSFSGTVELVSASLNLELSQRATLYFTADEDPGFDAGDYSWHLVSSATAQELSLATALRIILEAGDGPSAAVVNLTMRTQGNYRGDEYVLWMGPTTTSGAPVPQPWPVGTEVVASDISGTVWWDENADARLQYGEPGIGDVRVTLHAVVDGEIQEEYLAETWTDEYGSYLFEEFNSGYYAVRVHRNDVIPYVAVMPRGQVRDVLLTYSYSGRTYANTAYDSYSSSIINLGVGYHQQNVNFGFNYPIADSVISGVVWWDDLPDGRRQEGEAGIPSVRMSLFEYVDGELGFIEDEYTDADGEFVFDRLPVGFYVVRVNRDDVIPEYTMTLRGYEREVAQTYSWNNRFLGMSREDSSTIILAVRSIQANVNFGFNNPDPQIALDQSPAVVNCLPGGDFCDVHWDVTIANTGNSYLNDLTLFNRIDDFAQDISAHGEDRLVVVDAVLTWWNSVLLMEDGSVWQSANITRIGQPNATRMSEISRIESHHFNYERIVSLHSLHDENVLAVSEIGNVWVWGRLGVSIWNNPNNLGKLQVGSLFSLDPNVIFYITESSLYSFNDNGELFFISYLEDVVKITRNHLLRADGILWAWGYYTFATGVSDSSLFINNVLPPSIITFENDAEIVSLVVGGTGIYAAVFALADNGEWYGWGYNTYGQVGIGTSTSVTTPQRITSLSGLGVTELQLGASSSPTIFALADNGEWYGWGYNFGKLGIGTTSSSVTTPQRIISLSGLSVVESYEGRFFNNNSIFSSSSFTNYEFSPMDVSPYLRNILNLNDLASMLHIFYNYDNAIEVLNGRARLHRSTGGYQEDGSGDNSVVLIRPEFVTNVNDAEIFIDSYGRTHFKLASSGEWYGWGYNNYGQVGIGNTIDQSTPQRITSLSGLGVTELQFGGSSSSTIFALADNGEWYGWGSNNTGQLGIGTSISATTPQRITSLSGLGVTELQLGESYLPVFALTASGEWYGWGNNTFGQLGIGTSTSVTTPQRITVLDGEDVAKIIGLAFGVAVLQNGEFIMLGGLGFWSDGEGFPWRGGDAIPIYVEGLSIGEVFIADRGRQLFLLAEDGSLFVFGFDWSRDYSYWSEPRWATPMFEPSEVAYAPSNIIREDYHILRTYNIPSLAAGETHRMRISARYQRQEDAFVATSQSWVNSSETAFGLDPFVYVSTGGWSSSFGLTVDGSLYAWGDNSDMGMGITDDWHTQYLPGRVPLDDETVKLFSSSTDGLHVAYTYEGNFWTWGWGARSLIVDDSSWNGGPAIRLESHDFNGGIIDIAVANEHLLILNDLGEVWSWGANWDGQLGLGHTETVLSPTKVTLPLNAQVIHIAAGEESSFAITEDGQVWSWGSNSYGVLGGVSNYSSIVIPTSITEQFDGETITQIFAPRGWGYQVFAIDLNGQLWAWGRNNVGQLAIDVNAGTYNSTPPTRVNFDFNGERVVRISPGCYHTLALTESGQLWSWGQSSAGQLGTGVWDWPASTSGFNWVPQQVFTLSPVTSISAGTAHSLFTTNDGNTWAMGRNHRGQLGNGVSVWDFWTGNPETSTEIEERQKYPGLVLHNSIIPADSSSQILDRPRPLLPIIPTLANFDPRGIPGNPTCNTDATIPQWGQSGYDPATEDQCDQVPALIPGLGRAPALGTVAGIMWEDLNSDGWLDYIETIGDLEPLVEGATVTLLQNGRRIRESITNAEGRFQKDNIPVGEGFQLQFGVSHLDNPNDEAWAFTLQGFDSHVDSTGLSEIFSIAENETVEIDAGKRSTLAALTVVKTSELGDNVALQLPFNSYTDAIEVTFTITNTGVEVLHELEWEDVTAEGIEVKDWICDSDSTTIEQNASVTCRGVLPPMPAGDSHENIVTVTARGEESQQLATDSSNWRIETTTNALQLDKSVAEVTCEDGYCTAEWQVVIHNAGEEVIENVFLFDRQSARPEVTALRNSSILDAVAEELDEDTGLHLRVFDLGAMEARQMITVTIQAIYEQTEEIYIDVNQAWVRIIDEKLLRDPFIYVSTLEAGAIALTASGRVFSWGSNQSDLGIFTPGPCWNDPNEICNVFAIIVEPTEILGFSERIVQISAGDDMASALTESGKIYSWGINRYNQLGIVDIPNERFLTQETPGIVNIDHIPEKIVKISAGSYYQLALDAAGHVWAWGYNPGGNLGVFDYNPVGMNDTLSIPTKIDPNLFDGLAVVYIHAGARWNESSMVITEDGGLWGFGMNRGGSLGISFNPLIAGNIPWRQPITAPTRVFPSWGENTRVISVTSSQEASLMLDEFGRVWAAGGFWATVDSSTNTYLPYRINVWGELGTGDFQASEHPVLVNSNWGEQKIVSIRAGAGSHFAIAEDGSAWGWGFNKDYGIPPSSLLGIDSNDPNISEPMLITKHLDNETIVSIGTTWFTNFVTDAGAVWSFGDRWNPIYEDRGKLHRFDSPINVASLLQIDYRPLAPITPTTENFNSLGVPGNPTCNSSADLPQFLGMGFNPSTEDQCDQVPVLIPALEGELPIPDFVLPATGGGGENHWWLIASTILGVAIVSVIMKKHQGKELKEKAAVI